MTATGTDLAGERPRAPSLQYAPASAGRHLAVQLWLTSVLCWWVIGISYSRLWWLVNATQLRWILFCYAWEVPAVGWTGAVPPPYLGFRLLQRRLEAGDPSVGRDLVRYPMRVALLVIVTSSVGYLLGAIQVDHFSHLPDLEFAKITLQGPVLGGLFAVAAYLMTEGACSGWASRARRRWWRNRRSSSRCTGRFSRSRSRWPWASPSQCSCTASPSRSGSGSRLAEGCFARSTVCPVGSSWRARSASSVPTRGVRRPKLEQFRRFGQWTRPGALR